MILYVKVKPNQSKDKLEKIGDEWQVRLKAPATEGKANQHLIEYLSELIGIPKSKIRLLKGHTSKLKCLEIDGEDAAILGILERCLNR